MSRTADKGAVLANGLLPRAGKAAVETKGLVRALGNDAVFDVLGLPRMLSISDSPSTLFAAASALMASESSITALRDPCAVAFLGIASMVPFSTGPIAPGVRLIVARRKTHGAGSL